MCVFPRFEWMTLLGRKVLEFGGEPEFRAFCLFLEMRVKLEMVQVDFEGWLW